MIKNMQFFSLFILCFFWQEIFAENKPLGAEPRNSRERREDKTKGHLLAEPLFTTAKKTNETTGMGINAYLWKASLEALSEFQKKNVDPFGGYIETEWYYPEEVPDERLKIVVSISGRELKSDGLVVTVFKEKKIKLVWTTLSVHEKICLSIEEAILRRARALKFEEHE